MTVTSHRPGMKNSTPRAANRPGATGVAVTGALAWPISTIVGATISRSAAPVTSSVRSWSPTAGDPTSSRTRWSPACPVTSTGCAGRGQNRNASTATTATAQAVTAHRPRTVTTRPPAPRHRPRPAP
ncbi:hypothetical protein BJF90_35800 [Pseudonocardia sp. CNS-004]|nr:hypothetical protein BJF90_35800 [Pseudonocardia sp. CNS-004]